LAFGAALLSRWDANNTRKQIANAIARFKLDPERPADVVAATAYVGRSTSWGSTPTRPSAARNLTRRLKL
jgi:hypothetical protein